MPCSLPRPIPRCSLVGAFITFLTAAASNAGTDLQPNILWLLAEDTSPSAYSCYGEQRIAATPSIDALARQGVRYQHFYTTAPVCSPSRSAFNTGMYATTIGAHNHRTADKKPLPEGVRLLNEWLEDKGYFTANIRRLPEAVGFKGQGKTDWNFQTARSPFQSDNWNDLKAHQPFYAQINFQETHRPFQGERLTDPQSVDLPPYYADHPTIRADYASYLDSARALDRKIAMILDLLERDGLAGNTIVIFMGDNGEAHIRGKQFCYEEGLRVPMIIRWPKNIPAPAGYQPGTVDHRLLEAIDVAPTLLSLVGAPVPSKMQGAPFLGPLTGQPKRYVFGARDRCDETVMRIRTVRDARYRYIRTYDPQPPFFQPNAYKAREYPAWNVTQQLADESKLDTAQALLAQPRQPKEQLYDLIADPHEIHNLADSTRSEDIAALKRLSAELDAWVVRTDDQGRFPDTFSSLPLRKESEGRKSP